MKKLLFFVLILIMSFSASALFTANAETAITSEEISINENMENALTAEEAELLVMRIEEIREMDKSTLSAEEKLELRNELKDIKKAVQRQGGYVYIGVGTVLVILLLILLLR